MIAALTPQVSLTPLTPQDAHRLVQAGATLVDIRDADEHAHERIPGARLLPAVDAGGDPPRMSGPLIFHCKSGMRTQARAPALCACTEGEAYMMVGGIEAWKAAGLPVARTAGAPLPLQRQVMIAAGGLVLLGAAIGQFVHPAGWGLSAFVGAGLTVAGATGFCGMARLLALAPWNRTS